MGDRTGGRARVRKGLSPAAQTWERSTKGGELPSLVMWPGLVPDARPLDRGKPRDVDTEGGTQPADKSLIDRRLSLRSQLCAAHTFFLPTAISPRGALNCVPALDGEHKRLAVISVWFGPNPQCERRS